LDLHSVGFPAHKEVRQRLHTRKHYCQDVSLLNPLSERNDSESQMRSVATVL
jgi:hypothetical protein